MRVFAELRGVPRALVGRFVGQDELTLWKLPNGKQLVSVENLLARRAPQIVVGEDTSYRPAKLATRA